MRQVPHVDLLSNCLGKIVCEVLTYATMVANAVSSASSSKRLLLYGNKQSEASLSVHDHNAVALLEFLATCNYHRNTRDKSSSPLFRRRRLAAWYSG